MSRIDLAAASRLRVLAEIAVWRYGWRLPLAAVALLLALVLGAFWLPVQYANLRQAQEALAKASQQPASSAAQESVVPPLQQFRDILVLQDATISQLRVIHQKAVAAGLSVAQMDMRRQQDADGTFSQLQVSLPLKGSYLGLKRFCADLLQHIPSVSIDQMIVKREQSNSNIVDVQLTLSLWQASAVPSVGSVQ